MLFLWYWGSCRDVAFTEQISAPWCSYLLLLNLAMGKVHTLTRLSWSISSPLGFLPCFSCGFIHPLWWSVPVISSILWPFLDNSQHGSNVLENPFFFPCCLCCFFWTLLMTCHLWSAQLCDCRWEAPRSLWIFASSVDNLYKFCCSKTTQYPSWDQDLIVQQRIWTQGNFYSMQC